MDFRKNIKKKIYISKSLVKVLIMETQNLKRKVQTQPVYRAEAIIPTTFNYLPKNLFELKNDKVNKSVKNPNFAFVVDSSGVIVGFRTNSLPLNNPFTGKPNYQTVENIWFYITSEKFLGISVLSKEWNDMVIGNLHHYKKVKNPNYIGYQATNKIVNKSVKEKIYSKAFYKKYFKPITIDCKGNDGACTYHGSYITLKTWADDAVLLHELAHQYGRQHDSRFATAYLMLVGRFIGHKAQVELMASMREENVEWNGSFVHSKQCYLENGFPELAVNAGGQCTTGATKMNLGWQKRNLY